MDNVHSTFVFRHRTEADARRVFRAVMRRWPMMGEKRSGCSAWSAGDAMSGTDAARMALECSQIDGFEQRDLALDLLELSSWEQCLAKFAEWELEVADGALIETRSVEPDSVTPNPIGDNQ